MKYEKIQYKYLNSRQKVRRKLTAIYVLSISLTGCVGPLVPVVDIDPSSATSLREEVQIFTSKDLETTEYERLGRLSATSCMNKIWDPPANSEDATDQLRYKASTLGADGLTNLLCEAREGTNVAKNCWNSVTCHGVAIAIGERSREPRSRERERTASSGTGFLVSSDGHVVTNEHVIGNCPHVLASLQGESFTAQILRGDSVNDVALLKIERTGTHPLVFGPDNRILAGEVVIALGFPLAGVLSSEAHVTSGTVTALAGLRNDSRYLQMSAPIQPGNSGGPLLDAYGRIVGMVTSKLSAAWMADATGDIPQNVNFALNSSSLKGFLDANDIEYKTDPTQAELSIPEIAEAAKRAVLFIKCSRQTS